MTDDKSFEEKVAEAMGQITVERLGNVQSQVTSRELVAESKYEYYSGLMQWRRILTIASFALAIVSAATLFLSLPILSLISIVTLVVGVSLLVVTFLEIILGAGTERQREYKQGDEFGRESSFVVSIPELRHLLPPLAGGLLAIVVGFSSLHWGLAQYDSGSYSRGLDGLTSLYLSLVIFTSGIGDISPISKNAIILTSVEVLLSWLVLAVILAVTISWVLEHQRSQIERRTFEDEAQMQATEELMKAAKIGVYSDASELRKQAVKRVRAQERDSGGLN